MALVIRMRQQGASSRQQFRIVVIDERTRRDGKYTEMLGWYHPFGKENQKTSLDIDRLRYWIGFGVQVSDRVQSLVKEIAPEVIREMTAKEVSKRVKRRDRRKKK
ncbi:MAG TPA: 30S ribosomal protein S16 [Chlamydiales bacterium]|nr:30S ribosomal protein S16 [Chlamydiales bacterium]